MPPRDFTDSEEDDPPIQPSPSPNPPSSPIPNPPQSHPLRITLRPSINHLMNDHPPPPHPHQTSSIAPSERSSLSPPPPITLRFGIKPTSITPKPSETHDGSDSEVPKKKKKVHKRKSSAVIETQSNKVMLPKKSYDWLQPSDVGASHHGPHNRPSPPVSEGNETKPTPMTDDNVMKKIGSHKKKPDNTGPGKAWRKGLKKGMPIPWREGNFLETTPPSFSNETSAHLQLPVDPSILIEDSRNRQPSSLFGTPEPNNSISPTPQNPELQPIPIPNPEHPIDPPILPARSVSPIFVPADREKMGIPIYPRPIVQPKITLGTFPKVTQTFAPNNGGDPVFPRKERVRSWKEAERVVMGIGGGQLKFRSWAKGPSSELGRLIQADKEAKELHRAKMKSAAISASQAPDPIFSTSASVSLHASPNPTQWDRPKLLHTTSFDSSLMPDDTSEIGDGDSIVVPDINASKGLQDLNEAKEGKDIKDGNDVDDMKIVEESKGIEIKKSTGGLKGRGGKKVQKIQRKSKLAQEIVLTEGDLDTEV
ncbi:hypothetical protein M231_01267 [Tremella mesenterica]|uniref:Uncharacterized protein n=1 Tax=Tremella mesenterica TaxID=5217 RepID=A0A4Q1BTT1_TREME|nr:hypothetical protein M231_01267 [Tremella mesenterica]